MIFLNKPCTLLLSVAVIALLGVGAHYLMKANEAGAPDSVVTDGAAVAPVTEGEPSTITPVLNSGEKAEIIQEVKAADVAKNVDQKIDASTDKAMVDSLDYLSRQLDPAGQQQLQDDYSVIASVLTSAAIEDGRKNDDSLVKVREAVNGKTAAELTEIAEKLKPKG